MMVVRLENRVAVVTGGGSGIGAAICRSFAAEGAWVTVTDLWSETAEQVAAEIREAGGVADSCTLDVTKRASVEYTAANIATRFGPVDVWLNNAGISRVFPFPDCTDDQWDRVLEVNLNQATMCSRTRTAYLISSSDCP